MGFANAPAFVLTIIRGVVGVQEYALKAVDVLARRTRLAFLDMEAAKAAAPRVVKLMGTCCCQALGGEPHVDLGKMIGDVSLT